MLVNREEYQIGRVFTPIHWARWLIDRYGVYEAWRGGASLIDPTCGHGAFFIALMEISEERREAILNQDLRRLFGVEINPYDKAVFLETFRNRYSIEFPDENIVSGDFLRFSDPTPFDIAIGNPPWANFTELPEQFKEESKLEFIKYGLVTNKKDVLLGGSRTDISALIIQKCMKDHVAPDGFGYFFLPMSLFFNENANKNFRPTSGEESIFSVEEIVDFDGVKVFEGVATRNGLAALKRSTKQEPTIPLAKINVEGVARSMYCRTSSDGGAWSMAATLEYEESNRKIRVAPRQVARQGMNTGGLNKVFILERASSSESELPQTELFVNGFGEKLEISTQFVFPLMSGDLFGGKRPKRRRYILCLHDQDGRAFSHDQVGSMSGVKEYLERYRSAMEGRKGVLMRSLVSKGKYWSLLGVGPYSFSKYKVAWESLGKRSFKSVVLDGAWQGNQAMHAYIPAETKDDAERVCDELNARVPAYLEAFGMEGTCNWAQPGRIRRMLITEAQQKELF